jgi:diguanylate cyclase (GGDEF)-like protein
MLRLVMVEDDVLAAELTLRALQSAGLPCACERVASAAELRAALARRPDLILSDSNVPGLSGMAALAIAKAAHPTTPFIFVSNHMSEAAVRRALDNGATECLSKADLRRLCEVVRSALDGPTDHVSRGSDPTSAGRNSAADAEESADYLLQRQAALERSLRQPDGPGLSNLLSRTPPAPAALDLIESATTQDRYLKLLHTADIETDVASDLNNALQQLATRLHALLFTDRLDLIRAARQLNSGSAVHMIFIHASNEGAAAQGLRAGANDVMPEEGRGEQFWAHLAIARRIVSFAASLQSAITDNRLLSTLDELTRVGNRRYFEHQWPREVARAVRFGRPLSLVTCDIDHFTAINDQHGHPIGDEVLTETGERLTRGLRLGEDWVARVGGEEFAIVLPETGRFQARAIAERLRESLSGTPFLHERLSLSVTASFGFCSIEGTVRRALDLHERLVSLADSALYESKRAGRNCVTEALAPIVAAQAPLVLGETRR